MTYGRTDSGVDGCTHVQPGLVLQRATIELRKNTTLLVARGFISRHSSAVRLSYLMSYSDWIISLVVPLNYF